MRRRTKIFLQRLAILIGIILIAVAIIVFFKPRKTIDTTDGNNSRKAVVRTIETSEPIKIVLPENIVSKEENPNIQTSSSPVENKTTGGDKTYEPITETGDRYLIPLKKDDTTFKVLIGYDSEPLLTNSPVKVSSEYEITNMPTNILSFYFFKVDSYDYPILLVLGENKVLYYVDIQDAFATGNFQINGSIKNIPAVESVSSTTIKKDGKEYLGAVITCTNGEGYEFDISMIGR